jgi:hypothetical protein
MLRTLLRNYWALNTWQVLFIIAVSTDDQQVSILVCAEARPSWLNLGTGWFFSSWGGELGGQEILTERVTWSWTAPFLLNGSASDLASYSGFTNKYCAEAIQGPFCGPVSLPWRWWVWTALDDCWGFFPMWGVLEKNGILRDGRL